MHAYHTGGIAIKPVVHWRTHWGHKAPAAGPDCADMMSHKTIINVVLFTTIFYYKNNYPNILFILKSIYEIWTEFNLLIT
jgi:hypothetical protein